MYIYTARANVAGKIVTKGYVASGSELKASEEKIEPYIEHGLVMEIVRNLKDEETKPLVEFECVISETYDTSKRMQFDSTDGRIFDVLTAKSASFVIDTMGEFPHKTLHALRNKRIKVTVLD